LKRRTLRPSCKPGVPHPLANAGQTPKRVNDGVAVWRDRLIIMKQPLFVSYYTAKYRPHADKLVYSLKAFDLPHEVKEVTMGGTWNDVCRSRHHYIVTKMDENPGRPIVWLDADCIVLQRPQLFYELADMERAYDVALFRRPSGVCGGVIYAEQTSRWFWELCEKQVGDADQQVDAALKIAYDEKLALKVWPMEPSYQYCPWMMDGLESPLKREEVVILHAMRETGKQVKRI
jgi:hypothetical protein